ncbi:MAG: molybdopterin-binding protein, partial [Chloroflexi bacterium]|nr:molybdopterin-binding protein [Chloroflexota bacterium]
AGGHGPWPVRVPERIRTASDLVPFASANVIYAGNDRDEFMGKAGLPHQYDMWVALGSNVPMSVANGEIIAKILKNVPFGVLFELFSNELAEGFADIVLPDVCYLENYAFDSFVPFLCQPFGTDPWAYHIGQPIVEPVGQRRNSVDVAWEIVDRLGMRAKLNESLNRLHGLEGEYSLKPDEKVTLEELADRVVKQWFGPEHDWEWLKEHGFISWPKKVEEAYWRYFLDARTPIYLEYMVEIKDKVQKTMKEAGIDYDFTQYTPFISWTPSWIHGDNAEHDLYCYSYRDVLHTGSFTMEQPWLDEASRMNPYTYNITMNADTAKKKGLKDWDLVEVESVAGRKVRGRLKVMEGHHPRTMAIACTSGHWAKGMPIARGKGTNFDQLLEFDLQHIDPLNLGLEICVRVKVSKAPEG